MNRMVEFCHMFGIDLFQEIELYIPDESKYSLEISAISPIKPLGIRNPYYFTDEGIVSRGIYLQNEIIPELITGRLRIKTKT